MSHYGAKVALRAARLNFHIARVRYLRAIAAAERAVYRTDMPALLRKQA